MGSAMNKSKGLLGWRFGRGMFRRGLGASFLVLATVAIGPPAALAAQDGVSGSGGVRPGTTGGRATDVEQKPGFPCPPGTTWFSASGSNPTCIGTPIPTGPRACDAGPISWYGQDGSVCQGPIGAGANGATVGPVVSSNGNDGQATFKCNSGQWGYGGPTTCRMPGPAACQPQAAAWQVGGSSCSGQLGATPSGQAATISSTLAGSNGQATFACVGGAWTGPTAATCQGSGGSSCAAGQLTWSVGGQTCQAIASATPAGSSLTLTDSQGGSTGQATFSCLGGTWSAPSAVSCSGNGGTGNRSCSAANLSWRGADGSVCRAFSDQTSSGSQISLSDNEIAATAGTGAASFSCTDGTWNELPGAQCKGQGGCVLTVQQANVACEDIAGQYGVFPTAVAGTVDLSRDSCTGQIVAVGTCRVPQCTFADLPESCQVPGNESHPAQRIMRTFGPSVQECALYYKHLAAGLPNPAAAGPTEIRGCTLLPDCVTSSETWVNAGETNFSATTPICGWVGQATLMYGESLSITNTQSGGVGNATGASGSVTLRCDSNAGQSAAMTQVNPTCVASCPPSQYGISLNRTTPSGISCYVDVGGPTTGAPTFRTVGSTATGGAFYGVSGVESKSVFTSAQLTCSPQMTWEVVAGTERCEESDASVGGGTGGGGPPTCLGDGVIGVAGAVYNLGDSVISLVISTDGSTGGTYQCTVTGWSRTL